MKFKNIFINLLISVLLLLSCITSVSAQDLPTGVDESKQYAIDYRAHSSNIGWGDHVTSPAEAGTTGRALSLEAIQVKPDPENKVQLAVQPHVQDIGWSATRF